MKMLAASLLALTLAACGGAADTGRQAPTLELPLTAPEGAPPLIADFIEICSIAMEDPVKGAAALGRREGWRGEERARSAGMALAGMAMAEHGDTGVQIRIIAHEFPHLKSVTCRIDAFPRSGGFDAADLSPGTLADIDGFTSDVRTLPTPYGESMKAARYSGVAQNGDIIIISADMTPTFDMLFMARSTERIPETNTQDNK